MERLLKFASLLTSTFAIVMLTTIGMTSAADPQTTYLIDFSSDLFGPGDVGHIVAPGTLDNLLYQIGQCVPQVLEDRSFGDTVDGFNITFSDHLSCSGTIHQGALNLWAFNDTVIDHPTNNLYEADFNLFIPKRIVTTITTYTNGFRTVRVYSDNQVNPIFIKLNENANFNPSTAIPNLTTCSTNLGHIDIVDLGGGQYQGQLILQYSDIEDRTDVPVHVVCNKPISGFQYLGSNVY